MKTEKPVTVYSNFPMSDPPPENWAAAAQHLWNNVVAEIDLVLLN